jgi:hypothetical protein
MKSHYCHEEKAIIEFSGQCNWCGEKEMNNEPKDESFDRTASHMAGEYVSYPAKTLTDEEIYEVWKETTKIKYRYQHEEFARAILRKANEK